MFKFGKSTDELFTELKTEKNLEGWRSRNREEFVEPLNEYLEKILEEKIFLRAQIADKFSGRAANLNL